MKKFLLCFLSVFVFLTAAYTALASFIWYDSISGDETFKIPLVFATVLAIICIAFFLKTIFGKERSDNKSVIIEVFFYFIGGGLFILCLGTLFVMSVSCPECFNMMKNQKELTELLQRDTNLHQVFGDFEVNETKLDYILSGERLKLVQSKSFVISQGDKVPVIIHWKKVGSLGSPVIEALYKSTDGGEKKLIWKSSSYVPEKYDSNQPGVSRSIH